MRDQRWRFTGGLLGLFAAISTTACGPELAADAAPTAHPLGSAPPVADVMAEHPVVDLPWSQHRAYDTSTGPFVWAERDKLLASDGADDDFFGYSLSLAGSTVLVGARHAGPNVSGSAYVFVRDGAAFSQQQKLTPSDVAAGDELGYFVSLSGETALVGARYHQHGGADDAGSAYVFVRTGETWAEQAKLTAADAAAHDLFGSSVSVDGDTALVGAPERDDVGNDSGVVYTYERTGTSWSEQAKLAASDAAALEQFGRSVSLDGDTALVGASGQSSGSDTAGAVYVYVRTGAGWAEQDKLVASDAAVGAEFGRAVSLAGDTALVGAPSDDGGGTTSGAAYVFVRTGVSWTEEAKLVASDSVTQEGFGWALSLRGDFAMVGAPFHNGADTYTGAVYEFSRSGSSWSELSKLVVQDPGAYHCFGTAVGVGSEVVLVGAPYASGLSGNSGAVYEFWLAIVDGGPCSAAGECLSGYCGDEVCCDSACDGECDACDVSGSEGICTPMAAGSDGEPSCAPYVCDGSSAQCPSGCATNDDCVDEAVCDESGQCGAPLSSGSPCSRADQCASGQCIGGVCGLDEGDPCTAADECVSGSCLDGVCCAEADCSPFICGESGQCRQSCESTAHCVAGYTCSSGGQCVLAGADSSDEGCGCRQVGGRRSLGRWGWLAASLLATGVVVRRRRRL